MARTADPDLKPTQPATTYLTEKEMEQLDNLTDSMGRISRAAVLRYLVQQAAKQ